MIIKSFEIDKKKILEFKVFLIYGENEGLKKEIINKIKKNHSGKEVKYDETQVLKNTTEFYNQIKNENPHLWSQEFQQEIIAIIKEGVELEQAYAYDTMKTGILGLNADMFAEYVAFIANRRFRQIGLPEAYPGVSNPFPWMSEVIDLKKEKNFFETRVTEYQTGGALDWDDE